MYAARINARTEVYHVAVNVALCALCAVHPRHRRLRPQPQLAEGRLKHRSLSLLLSTSKPERRCVPWSSSQSVICAMRCPCCPPSALGYSRTSWSPPRRGTNGTGLWYTDED